MKRTYHIAIWGAVTAISFATFTAPVRAANDADKSKTSDTASDYKKAGRSASFQNDKSFGNLERVNKLIGKDVMSSDNQKIGKIDNLILDLESGRVLYAVVGSGGILG